MKSARSFSGAFRVPLQENFEADVLNGGAGK